MAVDLPSAFFLGSGTPGRPLTKALRRWRAAFAAVFSCKALAGRWGLAEALRRGPCHVAVDVGSAASAALFPAPATARSVGKSARPRWLAAFAVIRSCRAFLTVSGNRVIDILHRRPSFVALDIRAGDDQGAATVVVPCAASAVLEAKLSLVEHGRLVEVVKGKSADGLRQLRGVEEIAASLASNTDTGIDVGEGDSLLLRQKLFGSNTYKKPPARGFMSFVWEAFVVGASFPMERIWTTARSFPIADEDVENPTQPKVPSVPTVRRLPPKSGGPPRKSATVATAGRGVGMRR